MIQMRGKILNRFRAVVALVCLITGALTGLPGARAGVPMCFGEERTERVPAGARGHFYGTNGDDVIMGNVTGDGSGSLVVHGKDGDDRICVSSGSGGPLLKIQGNDGRDKMRGNRAQ